MMPTVRHLPDGRLLVPMRAESPDGTIGDALVEIGPDHPDYAGWAQHSGEVPSVQARGGSEIRPLASGL
jgi:hypothetical protein